MTIEKAIARARTDANDKAKLPSDPHAALAETGVTVPPGKTVKVVENTAKTAHIVLPTAPNNSSRAETYSTGDEGRPRYRGRSATQTTASQRSTIRGGDGKPPDNAFFIDDRLGANGNIGHR